MEKRGIEVRINLDGFLAKYLPDKSVVLTGKGRCAVCGRRHSSPGPWKRCAEKRKRREKRVKKKPFLFQGEEVEALLPEMKEGGLARFFISLIGFYPKIIVEDPSPIIIASFPEERIEEARKDLKILLDKASEKIIQIIANKLVKEISRKSKGFSLIAPKILEECNYSLLTCLDDLAGYYLVDLLSKKDPPFRKRKGYWEYLLSSSFYKEWSLPYSAVINFHFLEETFAMWLGKKLLNKNRGTENSLFRIAYLDGGLCVLVEMKYKLEGDKISWEKDVFHVVDLKGMKIVKTFGDEIQATKFVERLRQEEAMEA